VGRLVYDGTTFRLPADAVTDLLARGVITPVGTDRHAFELAADHQIDEVEAVAIVTGYRTGDDARGESAAEAGRRLSAVRFQHRDGQAGR
jgi:hypothetical protein